ncbi:sensor histidine kinase [Bacillus niameyensis]|uniref:sensor histidine kinase n=1 Tax=Bacillus niameyensis TaxID=1522308 RepID=UPI000ADB6E84|nr:HAMP domain-containing sensor histidine kinase [Bacillus niameyensis]
MKPLQSSVKLEENPLDVQNLSGLVASSFVHEFRNPLTVIHGFVQLLNADHPDLPYLDIILDEVEQLKSKTNEFLNANSFDHEQMIFNLNDLLDQVTATLLPRMLEFNVQLEKNVVSNLYVSGNREELKQVIINILFNAVEAMAAQEKKSLIDIHCYAKNGYTYIEIANSGPKIPESIARKIFEPFVTTKDTGTGLGLYICKEIIERQNGELFCHSSEEWTVFTIKLPVV